MLQAETEDWPLPTLLDSWTFRQPSSYPPPLQTLWQRNSETRYMWWPFTLYMYMYYHTHITFTLYTYMYYHTHSLQRACICITKSFTALGIYMYYKIIHSCKPIHVYEICTYIDIFVQISLLSFIFKKKTTPDTFCSMKFVWIKLNPDCRKERST